MNATRKSWTEEETTLALFLYFQLPFGQLHSGNPEIQKLAGILGRSNSSVAMKLCNFASLDPKITETGRKGLQGASMQDRRIWAKFSSDWTGNVAASDRVWNSVDDEAGEHSANLQDNVIPFAFEPYDGPSTTSATIDRRIGQNFFRRAVLTNFDNVCCITGIAEPVLLNASHIMPWGVDLKNRHNPANGLCLSATFDRAFDRGLIALDESHAVLISSSLLSHKDKETRKYFARYQGRQISQFKRFEPNFEFLKWHRDKIFV